MCALFGWLDYGHRVSHRALKKLTRELAVTSEERGTDASGIAYVQEGEIKIYKKPKPARNVRFDFPENTAAIMGHTRLATQGDNSKNRNNHPFYGSADRDFALAHNGILRNDAVLRKHFNLPQTPIETDSYIAVQLIEMRRTLDFENLGAMAEDVSGNFVFTVLDETNTLYIVKGDNPICLIHFEQFGLFVYASTDGIITQALKKCGLSKAEYEIIDVEDGDIVSINAFGKVERGVFNGFIDDYDLERELQLFEVCDIFGLCEENACLLLDYGYTAEEIEEMLIDDDLLIKTLAEVNQIERSGECCSPKQL